MSSQPRLEFEGYIAPRIENARVHKPADSPFCLRKGCGKPRPSGAKPGEYCSSRCRREASRERAEERRNRGKAIAASNHAPDLELARRLALEMLAARGVGTISDLREYAAAKGHELPWHLPWTGSVFQGQPPLWFEQTGIRENVRHLRGNWRKVNQYRLTAEGWAAWRGMRG